MNIERQQFMKNSYLEDDNEDVNFFNTSVRETLEETGLNLNEQMNYTSFYLGENPSFEITFDFNYIVFSHIFLILWRTI